MFADEATNQKDEIMSRASSETKQKEFISDESKRKCTLCAASTNGVLAFYKLEL